MKPERIIIDNFLGIKHLDFQFAQSGLFVVLGENRDSAIADSNGASKSTAFIDAMSWCFFGRVPREQKPISDEVVHNWQLGGKNCSVTVLLTNNHGEHINISRYRKHKDHQNKLIVLVDGVEQTRGSNAETQKLVNELLGVDYDVFHNTHAFASSNYRKFTSLDDSEKKAFRDKIIGFSKWDNAYAYTKVQVDRKLALAEDTLYQITTLEKQISDGKENLDMMVDLSDKWEGTHNQAVKEFETAIRGTELRLEGRSKEERDGLNAKSQAANTRIGVCQSEIGKLQRQSDAIRKYAGQDCPLCTNPIPNEFADEIVKKLEKESGSLESEIPGLKKIIQECNSELLSKYDHFDADLRQLQIQESQLDKVLKDSNPYIQQLASKKEKIASLEQKHLDLSLSAAEQMDEVEKHQFWLNAFGLSGIKSLLLEQYTPFINDRLAYYTELLSENQFNLSFNTVTKLKSGELRDKMEIGVNNSIGASTYAFNSDGEKRRVDIPTMFAFLDLGALHSRESWTTLFLDEIFEGSLDESGAQRLANLLNSMARDKAIYCISHDSNLLNVIGGTKVTVVREKGEVRVEM